MVGVGPYLNLSPSSYKVLICPSDPNPDQRISPNNSTGYGLYPFSYQVNWAMGCSPAGSINPLTANWGGPYYRKKITQVVDTSVKVLLIEADERYTQDGQTAVSQQSGVNASWCNLLADRHDTVYRMKPDWAPDGSHGNVICNSKGKGNVAFCDGHADYLPRSYVHTLAHSMPDPSTDCPRGWTEPTMQ
jgi:prepilin-type processing-associated H-X9-DG protein